MKSSVKVLSAGVVSVAMAMAGCGGGGEEGAPNPQAGTGGGAGSGAGTGTAGTTAGTGVAGTAAGTGVAGTTAGTGTAGTGSTMATLEGRFPEVTDWAALEIVYPAMYSAFVPGQTFKLPVRVRCASVSLENWHAEPESAVTFDADPENPDGVMITIVEPVENITIAAITGTLAGTAPLTVTIGTQELWAMGEARYNNGADWMLDWAMPEAPPPDTKCTVCHSENSSAGFDIQHTPTQAARISDAALEQIMTTGTKPADVEFRVLPESFTYTSGFPPVEMMLTNADLYKEFHLWDTTDDGIKGMILYLRSLTPRGQGCVMNPMTMMCEDPETPGDECN